MSFRPVIREPLRLSEFFVPLKLFLSMNVLIPTIACSIIFGFASVLFTVEIPPLFQRLFKFNPEQIGLQFISLMIGYVLGLHISYS